MSVKRTSLIIAACMIINNAGFVGAVEMPIAGVSAPAVQTSVSQLITLVRLPFTITSKIFREEAPLYPGYAKPHSGNGSRGEPADRKDQKARKECGFIVSGMEKEVRLVSQTADKGGAETSVLQDLIRGSGTMWVSLIFYWLGFKYIFLLACLMSLSKSNLPWEIRDSYA